MTPLGPEVERRGMCHNLLSVRLQSSYAEYQVTHSIIPERDRVALPAEAHLEVHVATDLLEQEVQDGVRLSLGNADDATRESWVDVDTLPAGDGMNADDGVDRLNGFATNVESGSAGTISLGDTAVESAKAFQVGLQPRAEGRVKGIAEHMRACQYMSFILSIVDLPRTPEGVTPIFRAGDNFERCRARGLDLVCYVAVPEFQF